MNSTDQQKYQQNLEDNDFQPQAYRNWRWVRDDRAGWLGGVCAGLARQFDVPPLLVRLGWFIFAWLFVGILAYLLCWLAFPKVSRLEKSHEKVVLGVCARIGRRGDIEVGLARLIALALLVVTGGSAIVGYIVLHFVLGEPTAQRSQV